MLGDKIKKLRLENSLTQKDLAEKLYVTAQAVSRWENNEVEPSISTLSEMAKVFNVSVSELLGEQVSQKVEEETETVFVQPQTVLAVCEKCNEPIYNGQDIVRKQTQYGTHVYCKHCDEKLKQVARQKEIREGRECRIKSFVWGGIFSVIIAVVLGLIFQSVTAGVIGLFFFPFISCLYLDNTFIADMVTAIATWSVRMPGLIFTLDLDGIIWFLTVKLVLWILGGLLSVFLFLLAVSLGYVLSIFVYPFAIVKNIRHPEYSSI